MNKILFSLLCLTVGVALNAQVTSVKYSLEFNSETCLFDAYVNIEEGAARTAKERLQLNAQYTIVAPSGSEMIIEEVYLPFQDNQRYRSANPIDWYISSEVDKPVAMPHKKFFGIAPQMAPAAFYNDSYEGDKLKLFSVSISPMVECAKEVELYDYNIHPHSNDMGMVGSDFNQGFTMGGLNQIYNGNYPVVRPSLPMVLNLNPSVNGNEVSVAYDLSQDQVAYCQGQLSYEWEGPNGKIGNGVNFPIKNKQNLTKGEYALIIKDEIGCQSRTTFNFDQNTTVGNEVFFGAEEIALEDKGFSIFPNPTKDVINITVKANVGDYIKGQLIDQNGKIVNSNLINEKLIETNQTISIPVTTSAGVYSLSMTINNSQVQSQKVILIK